MAALQDLVDALAERLGRPVAIEDRRYRVLAYSAHAEPLDRVRLASILAREAPPDVVGWLDAQGLPRAQAPMRLPEAPEIGMGARIAVPVRGDGLLGFLWLVDDGVGAAELAAAEAAAARAAPLLAELRDAERSEHVLVADLLGADPAARRRAARELEARGHRGPVRVLAGAELAGGLPRHPRLLSGPRAALLLGDDAALDALAAAAGGPIGASAPRARLDEAHAAEREAAAAFELAQRGLPSPARWERLGAYQLLGPLAGAPPPAPLQRLLDHPDAAVLVPTLAAFLDRAGDAAAAAADVFVHRTTLYHRLRRIEGITGADLRSGDDRLLLHAGLRLHALGRLR